jgi:anti-sigma28 factor (negative regulator of flagellin synthesis)
MSSIHGVGNNSPLQRVINQPVLRKVAGDCSSCSDGDKVELSGEKVISQLKLTEVRSEKVASVKAQIEAGTYEDDQKLDAAIEKLLDKLNG